MKYPRILAALKSARWAVTPRTLQAISDVLGAHLRGSPVVSLIPDAPGPAATPQPQPADLDSVAVIPVHGILGKNLSGLEMMCGGCDVGVISQALAEAVADDSITAIVLDFDSPGGVVTGIPELTSEIEAADQVKPVYAFSENQCCSGAYWLASACRAIGCTSTADLGSIGVYVALVDDSEWWKNEGYKLELIKAGQFKAMGISGQPLAPEERQLIQQDVDTIYQMFTGAVRGGRGEVADQTMQGQTFMGASAVTAGLADEVHPSLEDYCQEVADLHAPPPFG